MKMPLPKYLQQFEDEAARKAATNQQQHTPEPWIYRPVQGVGLGFLISAKNCGIAKTTGLHYDNEENARRIVACVNACAEVPDSALQTFVFDAIQAREQRDELAAALRGALANYKQDPCLKDWLAKNGSPGVTCNCWQCKARAALAKLVQA